MPWFYRTLRNAAIDRFRRETARARAFENFARELESQADPRDDMQAEICGCIARVAGTLKPEYADALNAIEIDGKSVQAYAQEKGLTPSNAAVRVFRAREALKRRLAESCGMCAEHGCIRCTCRPH